MHIDKLLNFKFDPVEQLLSRRDSMLYALGIGFGSNPLDSTELQFVYEDGLKVFPSQAVVIARPSPWATRPELAIDYLRLLHAEQSVTQHKCLIADNVYVADFNVLGVRDKGEKVGCLVYLEKKLYEKVSGDLASTVVSAYFLRGDGGCGDAGNPPENVQPLPVAKTDAVTSVQVPENAALMYRLSGDDNPIHADPRVAVKAGFPKPLLHGLCTFGIALRVVLGKYCDNRVELLESFGARFSKPLFPGDCLDIHIWHEEPSTLSVAAFTPDGGTRILDLGIVRFHKRIEPS